MSCFQLSARASASSFTPSPPRLSAVADFSTLGGRLAARAEVRGASLAYERRGIGQPVLLLHGIGSHREVWRPLLAALIDRYEMLIPDLPGHGGSPRLTPDRRWGVEAYVESIEPFLDEVGLTTPHVVGNSLGATIALELASRGRAASAVALAPIGFWSRPES